MDLMAFIRLSGIFSGIISIGVLSCGTIMVLIVSASWL